MKTRLLLMLFYMGITNSFAQINIADSTAQVIGYWDKKEKQTYTVTQESIKVKGTDTTSRETMKYDVDITILDSTATSYTIEWHYRNFNLSSSNVLALKMARIQQDLKVVIKTNEMGSFQEVVNWKEVRNQVKKSVEKLKRELGNVPQVVEVLKKTEGLYNSKEAIEAVAVNDIQQFYTFHGGKYTLGELLEGQMKVYNPYGSEPFDSEVTVYLDEIDTEDSNVIMRATHEINQEQLIKATHSYLVDISKNLKVTPPKLEDLKDISNEILVASRIHESGWVMYSVQTKIIKADNTTSIEERTIDLQ
ncbi:hypothetical protein [Rufibacter roseus]|uniref:Uncharacterized protein n=1 Tax=Rufibacter roseus TaxID=1567108 RepID=A0ABW2DP90_9BACT|nr:hypothetical protein [Rufibacter roseus]